MIRKDKCLKIHHLYPLDLFHPRFNMPEREEPGRYPGRFLTCFIGRLTHETENGVTLTELRTLHF
jgi:hypothetical protein